VGQFELTTKNPLLGRFQAVSKRPPQCG